MENNKHLLILIGGHLASAPRAQKEAQAAREAGFRVSIRGMWHDDSLSGEDEELARVIGAEMKPLLDLRYRNRRALTSRIQGKAARVWLQISGRPTATTFGLTAPIMLREARALQPDLVMVHSEAGLWAGRKLLQEGFRVGVDFEDWFSEDLPASSRTERPVKALKDLERTLLHHAHTTFTTTKCLARELARSAGCERIPSHIPNAFPPIPNHEAANEGQSETGTPLRFYWFSQTIGPGRGLELLAEALSSVEGNWELHLRGNLRSYQSWFEETFSKLEREKIVLHSPVPNRDLSRVSSQYDVGLALETPDYPNRDLTASNKIFEYMRSGLAVVATRTKGQEEVMAACPEAGWLVSPSSSEELSTALQDCVRNPNSVTAAKSAARTASGTVWSWTRFSPSLRSSLEQACS